MKIDITGVAGDYLNSENVEGDKFIGILWSNGDYKMHLAADPDKSITLKDIQYSWGVISLLMLSSMGNLKEEDKQDVAVNILKDFASMVDYHFGDYLKDYKNAPEEEDTCKST